jgi:hypothetical protein
MGISAETDERENALVVVGPQLPTAAGARASIETYLGIQRVFDEKMPDAIMEIQGKMFRKKAYWRAIATAFKVDCVIVIVDRIEIDGDWGYDAIVRATSDDGRTSDGDGSCMASEKSGGSDTVHNVRSHAVTRAKNRAISDLVGFGEVSADELGPDASGDAGYPHRDNPQPDDVPRAPSRPASQPSGKAASEKQLKLLYAKSLARANVMLDDALLAQVTPKIQSDKELRGHISQIAAERVGCGEVILGKEINPLLAAIECIQFNEDGETVYAGVVSE